MAGFDPARYTTRSVNLSFQGGLLVAGSVFDGFNEA